MSFYQGPGLLQESGSITLCHGDVIIRRCGPDSPAHELAQAASIDVGIAKDHPTWTGPFGPGLPVEAFR